MNTLEIFWVYLRRTHTNESLIHHDVRRCTFFLASENSDENQLCSPDYLRIENWIQFNRRCSAAGIAPLDVPADGDCMAWAIRCLLLGHNGQEWEYESRKAKSEKKKVRTFFKDAWIAKMEDPLWQELFATFHTDYAEAQPEEEEEEVKTPPKKAPKNGTKRKSPPEDTGEDGAMVTPPRVECKRVRKAGEGKAAPVAVNQFPASPQLQLPGPSKNKKKVEKLLEPECPDVEEEFANAMLDLNALPPENMDESMLDERQGGQTDHRAHHERKYRSRPKSENEVKMEKLQWLLAQQGLTYLPWLTEHRRANKVKNAGCCPDGKWSSFKQYLLCQSQSNTSKKPEKTCGVCARLLQGANLTLEKITHMLDDEAAITNFLDAQRQPAQSPAEAGVEEEQEPGVDAR